MEEDPLLVNLNLFTVLFRNPKPTEINKKASNFIKESKKLKDKELPKLHIDITEILLLCTNFSEKNINTIVSKSKLPQLNRSVGKFNHNNKEEKGMNNFNNHKQLIINNYKQL